MYAVRIVHIFMLILSGLHINNHVLHCTYYIYFYARICIKPEGQGKWQGSQADSACGMDGR